MSVTLNRSNAPNNVLLIGSLNNDAIRTAVKSAGYTYSLKLLQSSVTNWHQIAQQVEYPKLSRISCVICHFSESDLHTATLPAYWPVYLRLIRSLKHLPHLVLVYDSNLYGKFTCLGDVTDALGKLQEYDEPFPFWEVQNSEREILRPKLKEAVNELTQIDVHVGTYKTIIERNRAVQIFIDEEASGLLLRLYVPNDRLWSQEIDRLIVLLNDYLIRVKRLNISLQQAHTSTGKSFSFHAKERNISENEIRSAMDGFSSFLDTCVQAPKQAVEILVQSGVATQTAEASVERYARETKRILIDMEYDRRRKLTDIEHRLASELIDLADPSLQSRLMQQVVIPTAPAVNRLKQLPGITSELGCLPLPVESGLDQSVVALAQDIAVRAIRGTAGCGELEDELIRRINEIVSGYEAVELSSAVSEIKDQAAPESERQSALQKVRGFLARNASSIGEVAIKAFISYLEDKLKGK